MEIKIDKTTLYEGLSWVQSVVERKTTMPILSNVLIEAKGSSVTLTATDLEVGVIGDLKAEVVTAGKMTVPAKGLYDMVKELPDQKVLLRKCQNNWLELECGRSRFKLVGMDPAEFPSLPKKQEGARFQLDGETLLGMLAKVDMAISSDETRYNLNGILIETETKDEKNKLRFAATDGHRLSLCERELTKKIPLEQSVIFPRKGVVELKRMLEDKEGEVSFWVDPKQAAIEKDEKFLFVRLIDGQFPPYAQVIPQKAKRVLSVSREELVRSLRRVAVVTTDRSRGVRFSLSPGHLEISANNPDLGEAKEELTCQYKGGAFSTGFNAAYFLDCLAVLGDEQVVLQLGDEVAPCLIQSETDRGFTHVIMPMRI
ncbi:MAG: DNA polymerase III subunit beta [Deltaproteobacteria bacterium]|nr:DNA polymerase III subunit beta [Deltaproteobacteria bacterium]